MRCATRLRASFAFVLVFVLINIAIVWFFIDDSPHGLDRRYVGHYVVGIVLSLLPLGLLLLYCLIRIRDGDTVRMTPSFPSWVAVCGVATTAVTCLSLFGPVGPIMSYEIFVIIGVATTSAGFVLGRTMPPYAKRYETGSRARMFVASSSASLHIARTVKEMLSSKLQVRVWDEEFEGGILTLSVLDRIASTYDYGVFILAPDDEVVKPAEQRSVSITRDNVIFELGLFSGHNSLRRSLVLEPSDVELRIATDLLGLTTIRYEHGKASRKSGKQRDSAIAEAVGGILSSVESLEVAGL